MDELITLGQVVKAQGIKGEVKVKPFTDDVSRFSKLRAVFLDSVPFKIESLRIFGGFVFIKFCGFVNRNQAQEQIGKFVRIDRIHAIVPNDGAYFIADLIGCDFFVDEKLCGKVANVHQHGAADVFEVKLTSGKLLLFPHLKSLNLDVDLKNKKICCLSTNLSAVAVYQD